MGGCISDAADEAGIAAAVADALDRFGGLDILIANAGTEGALKPIEALSVEEFEDTMRTNVTGVWLAMKHCVAPLKARGGGSIVALSSIAGCIGFPAMAPYIASKHAVYGLVKTAALEFSPSSIRVNAVASPIDNRMIDLASKPVIPDDPAALRTGIEASIAMRRYGTNEEVAHLLGLPRQRHIVLPQWIDLHDRWRLCCGLTACPLLWLMPAFHPNRTLETTHCGHQKYPIEAVRPPILKPRDGNE